MNTLLTTYTQVQQLINYAKTSPYKEICGAIMGEVRDSEEYVYDMVEFVPITNIAPEGIADYIMDPNELLQKVLMRSSIHMDPNSPLAFIGVFHNHPYWRPIPSEMDIEGAGYTGIYIIYSNLYDDLMVWLNQGSDDPNVTTAMHNGNRGFDRACICIR